MTEIKVCAASFALVLFLLVLDAWIRPADVSSALRIDFTPYIQACPFAMPAC